MSAKQKNGSGLPPLNQQNKQSRDGSATRGPESQNPSSPEGAKENGEESTGWKSVPLGELCERITKGSSPNWQGFDYCESGIIFVRSQNVGWGDLKLDEVAHLPASFNEKEKESILKADDVLLNLVGASIGRACVASSEVDGGNVNQAVAVIRVRPEVLIPKFLVHFLISPAAQARIHSETVDVARANFSLEDTRSLSIPLPPLPEQRRIVAEIEKQFTRLEAGVAALRRVQANLKRYRAAVLKAACEGKLVPTEAELTAKTKPDSLSASSAFSVVKHPAYESGEELLARILTERRQNWLARRSLGEGGQGRGQYKEPTTPDTAKLSALPEGWAWATVAQLSTRVVDGTHHTPEYIPDGVAFISVKDIRGGIIHFDDCKFISPEAHAELSKRCDVERGDVLITKSGTIGRMAVVNTDRPFSLFVSVALIKPVRGIFDSKFLKLAFEGYIGSINISQDVKGALLKNLHLEDLRVVPLRLPPLAEQTRIVAEVERRLSVVEELEAVVSTNLQRATRLRQSILQKAFKGKLV